MTQIKGILTISRHNEDTKSEGRYATLCSGQKQYLLYMKGYFSGDISPFLPYDNTQVIVEGEQEATGFFLVQKISIATENTENPIISEASEKAETTPSESK